MNAHIPQSTRFSEHRKFLLSHLLLPRVSFERIFIRCNSLILVISQTCETLGTGEGTFLNILYLSFVHISLNLYLLCCYLATQCFPLHGTLSKPELLYIVFFSPSHRTLLQSPTSTWKTICCRWKKCNLQRLTHAKIWMTDNHLHFKCGWLF